MLIVFEGLERVGKSTQIKLLAAGLKRHGLKSYILHTSEIFGKDVTTLKVDHRTKFFLYWAALSEASIKIEEKIREGYIILADRYIDSQFAFTPLMRVPREVAPIINEAAIDFIRMPDLTFYIDGRQFGKDFLTPAQRQIVREAFIKSFNGTAVLLDNAVEAADVHEKVMEKFIEKFLDLKFGKRSSHGKRVAKEFAKN